MEILIDRCVSLDRRIEARVLRRRNQEARVVVAISFVLYTLFVVGIGLWASTYTQSGDDDYFLAGRSLGPWVAALSASASSESGWVTLGLVGEAFDLGLVTFWILPGCLGGYLFNWLVMAPFLRERSAELEALTLPDLLANLYRKHAGLLRTLSVLVIFSMMMLYVGAQLTAAGKAIRAVFDVPYVWGVLIGAGIVLAYSISGGFRAVCWTDTVQALMMAFALLVLPAILFFRIGGWDDLTAGLAAAEAIPGRDAATAGQVLLSPLGKPTLWAGLGFVVGFLGIGLGYPGQPHVLVRFMAARDRRALRGGAIVAFGWGLIVYTGAIVLGLCTRVLYHSDASFAERLMGTAAEQGANWSENSLPVIAGDLLPGVLVGLVLAAILAAMASTADSQLVVAASAFAHDFVGRVWGGNLTERQRGWVSRATVAVLGLLALILAATQARDVFDFVLYAWAGLGAAFGPPLILSRFWRGTTGAGAAAGMITGIVVTVAWVQIELLDAMIYELVPAFTASLLVVWLVSLLTRGGVTEPEEILVSPGATTP